MYSPTLGDTTKRPMNPLARNVYRTRSKEVMEAESRVALLRRTVYLSSLLDETRYEFPGDKTYQRYLQNKGVIL